MLIKLQMEPLSGKGALTKSMHFKTFMILNQQQSN
jgi:hypothetical protein